MKKKLCKLVLSACIMCTVFTIPVYANSTDITISSVEPTLFIREAAGSTKENPKYQNDVKVKLNNKNENFINAWCTVCIISGEILQDM